MLSYLSGQHFLAIRNHLGQFNIAMEAIAYLSSMIYLVKVCKSGDVPSQTGTNYHVGHVLTMKFH